jgi:hypothetical protein
LEFFLLEFLLTIKTNFLSLSQKRRDTWNLYEVAVPTLDRRRRERAEQQQGTCYEQMGNPNKNTGNPNKKSWKSKLKNNKLAKSKHKGSIIEEIQTKIHETQT